MNERVMQFRIGMFVIGAGLVLMMLLVWFGESPALFQEHHFVTVLYDEAPGVAIGIPVRKSGIRVGEVAKIEFDRRPNKGDGVLVTLALDPTYRINAGVIPRLSRALIGDVAIDLVPGRVPNLALLVTSKTPLEAMREDRIIRGEVAPDPTLALEAVTKAFDRADATMSSLDQAAQSVKALSVKAQNLDDFIATWSDTGKKLSSLAQRVDQITADNEGELKPTLASFRSAADRFNATFDAATQKDLKDTAHSLARGSAQFDRLFADVGPVMSEIAGSTKPGEAKTQLGQALARVNRIAYDISLLTDSLVDSSGKKLNTNGSLQRLVTRTELYDNLNRAAAGVEELTSATRPVVRSLGDFAERVSRDPSIISRGILQPR